MIKTPHLRKQASDEPVRDERIVSGIHWEQVGTGETLTVETTLKNSKGEAIPLAQAQCILEHYNSLVLSMKGEQVDKKKVQYFIVNPDGSTGDQVAPYPPTERIRVVDSPSEVSEQGDGYWVSSTVLGEFLIHEEYELPAADPRNDAKLFKEAEDAAKRDEIVVTTFSNGGFTQYYGFLVPLFKDGKFVWVLKISDKKVEYRCLRDIPAPSPIPFREVKTLETLPPIQALLTVPTAKKKA